MRLNFQLVRVFSVGQLLYSIAFVVLSEFEAPHLLCAFIGCSEDGLLHILF